VNPSRREGMADSPPVSGRLEATVLQDLFPVTDPDFDIQYGIPLAGLPPAERFMFCGKLVSSALPVEKQKDAMDAPPNIRVMSSQSIQ